MANDQQRPTGRYRAWHRRRVGRPGSSLINDRCRCTLACGQGDDRMNEVLTGAWRTLVPRADDEDGPLPPLLLALTVVTGLVDAFSYLVLGQVFVANMTGNVVFLGFALAGASRFSAPASLSALGAFSIGAVAGGRLGTLVSAHRGHLLAVATT